MVKNIFVLGLDELNLETLQALAGRDHYRFHGLLSVDELVHGDELPLADLLAKASRQLEAFDGRIDAIIGYWDFPVSSMVPLLCRRFGLRSSGLEAVVKCEHKYWSRLEQQKVIDEHPRFALVDLDDPACEPPHNLEYPFWLKPVKSFSSELAFRIEDRTSFQESLGEIRAGIERVGKPFQAVMDHVDLPAEVAEVGAMACLAEEAVGGHQATIEGYALDGEVVVYGAIDSICYPDSPSFLRFQYPSSLPAQVFDRMAEASRRVVRQVGLDAVTFNIEYFWDPEKDRVSLLEVNPRHSQSHAPLFEHVDGMPNHKCMVELALGRGPDLPHRKGDYGVAAKWFLRRFEDGLVTRSPTPEEVARVEEEVPGTAVALDAHEGDRLSELHEQDSYSYKLAHIYIGANDEDELVAKYRRCVEALPFEFDE